jgi:hypothetical protein
MISSQHCDVVEQLAGEPALKQHPFESHAFDAITKHMQAITIAATRAS